MALIWTERGAASSGVSASSLSNPGHALSENALVWSRAHAALNSTRQSHDSQEAFGVCLIV